MRALGAAMLRRETDRPIFVLCTDETNAGTLAADLEAMLGESVVQLTGRDLALRDIEVVSRQEEQRRLRALDALYAGALVAVCTVSGLLQRTLPPDILENAAFTLRLGEGEGPEALEPRLLACGYRRSDMVEGPGQFSRRGGILDIFPRRGAPRACRVLGRQIDCHSGFFDTDTQRRAENIESFRVLPACESRVDPSRAGSIAKALLSRAARAERRRAERSLRAVLRRGRGAYFHRRAPVLERPVSPRNYTVSIQRRSISSRRTLSFILTRRTAARKKRRTFPTLSRTI